MRPSVPVADNKAVETTGLAETAGPAAVSRPPRAPRPRDVVILGSTGSIGTQALDIIRRNPDRFRVTALAAGGGQPGLLARQAAEFGVAAVAVATPAAAAEVLAVLRDYFSRRTDRGVPAPDLPLAAGGRPEVLAGPDAVCEVAGWPCDVVLNGVNGLTNHCQAIIAQAASLAQHT